jgi:hypothetical protein
MSRKIRIHRLFPAEFGGMQRFPLISGGMNFYALEQPGFSWEISRMTTVAKADKSRLTIRGLVDGNQYIVREQPDGWFITPEKNHRLKKTGMSADSFAKLYRSRSPLGADTAKEIAANLAAIDKAK